MSEEIVETPEVETTQSSAPQTTEELLSDVDNDAWEALVDMKKARPEVPNIHPKASRTVTLPDWVMDEEDAGEVSDTESEDGDPDDDLNEDDEEVEYVDDEDEDDTPEGEEEVIEGPRVTFKVGDKAMDIPEDAVLTVPVDGVETEISLKDFKNGISGQVALQKRFSALDRERKQVNQDIETWNTNVSEFEKLRDTQGYLPALDYLLATAGMSAEEHLIGVINELAPRLEEFIGLDDSERARRAAAAQAERHRVQLEAAQRETERLRAEQTQSAQIRQVQEAYGLNDDTFAEFYYALEDEMSKGTLTQQPISPELVGQYSLLRTREGWAREALGALDSSLADDSGAVTRLTTMASEAGRRGEKVTQQTMKMLADQIYAPLVKPKTPNKGRPKARTTKSMVQRPKAKQVTRKIEIKDPRLPTWAQEYLD